MKTLPAAVYTYDQDEGCFRRHGTWPRVPYEEMLQTWGSIETKVENGMEKPVLNPPPAHQYTERCCETCKFHRDTDFMHWVICAGPARDMICQGHVTRRDAPPILVEKRFRCKFYEGLK